LSGSRAFKSRKQRPIRRRHPPARRFAPAIALRAFCDRRRDGEFDALQRLFERFHAAGKGDTHVIGRAEA